MVDFPLDFSPSPATGCFQTVTSSLPKDPTVYDYINGELYPSSEFPG